MGALCVLWSKIPVLGAKSDEQLWFWVTIWIVRGLLGGSEGSLSDFDGAGRGESGYREVRWHYVYQLFRLVWLSAPPPPAALKGKYVVCMG